MATKVKELMKIDPIIISPELTLAEAAHHMNSIDCGVLPVGTWQKLEGIITDRDIVVRAVANSKDVNTEKVKTYMTHEVFFCGTDDTLEQAAQKMRKNNVNRLVVQDKDGKACGIITFGCIIRKNDNYQEINKVIECTVGKKKAA